MEYPRAYKWNIIEYPRIFNDGYSMIFHLWAYPRNIHIRIPHVGSCELKGLEAAASAVDEREV